MKLFKKDKRFEDSRDFQEYLDRVMLISERLQYALKNDNVKWESNEIQFFLPVILYFTNFDWLMLCAEHYCTNSEKVIINRFFNHVKHVIEVNERMIGNKMRRD